MSTCLIALGSNLGDREATLNSAIAEIDALAGVVLRSHSKWHTSQPVGCSDNKREFLNGVALCETASRPQVIVEALQSIETGHGRQRTQRWADRTLDLDLLLYDDCVLETPPLTLPHPRMSFRRFVLEPAVEIAGQMVHPTVGWTLVQLLRHLDQGTDRVAIVSLDESRRRHLADLLVKEFPASNRKPHWEGDFARLWPIEMTTWVSISASAPDVTRPYDGPHDSGAQQPSATVKHPKLTILLDPATGKSEAGDETTKWAAIWRQMGRGPTLRIGNSEEQNLSFEAFAAMQAVWPALSPRMNKRLE